MSITFAVEFDVKDITHFAISCYEHGAFGHFASYDEAVEGYLAAKLAHKAEHPDAGSYCAGHFIEAQTSTNFSELNLSNSGGIGLLRDLGIDHDVDDLVGAINPSDILIKFASPAAWLLEPRYQQLKAIAVAAQSAGRKVTWS